jgi:hypothetical protein
LTVPVPIQPPQCRRRIVNLCGINDSVAIRIQREDDRRNRRATTGTTRPSRTAGTRTRPISILGDEVSGRRGHGDGHGEDFCVHFHLLSFHFPYVTGRTRSGAALCGGRNFIFHEATLPKATLRNREALKYFSLIFFICP